MSVLGADISNAYLTAPTTEKVWTILGPEWGSHAGKKAIIVRALYGLKSSGAAYRNSTLHHTYVHLGSPRVWQILTYGYANPQEQMGTYIMNTC
jgi:hypothetical protein